MPGFDLTDWQLFVYILFSLLILFSAWQGWLHGTGRCVVILIGTFIGFFAGKSLGFIIKDLYDSLIPYPQPIVDVLTNIVFGIMVYLVFLAASIFMFKSTRKQTELKKKLMSGVGGVFFGICNGLIVAVFLAILIRTIGILQITIPPQPGSVEYRQKQDVYLPEHLKENAKIAVNLSRAIMNPPIESWVTRTNPIPESYFTLLRNFQVFSQREDLLELFIANEHVQNLLHAPEIATVVENSTIPQQIGSGNFHSLLKNPKFHELYEKQGSEELMASIDWPALTSQIIEASDLANHPDL